MEDAMYFGLRGMEKLILSNVAIAAVAEIENELPGVIPNHADEVCAIFKKVFYAKADEVREAKRAERRRVIKAAKDAEQEAEDAKRKKFKDSLASLPDRERISREILGC